MNLSLKILILVTEICLEIGDVYVACKDKRATWVVSTVLKKKI